MQELGDSSTSLKVKELLYIRGRLYHHTTTLFIIPDYYDLFIINLLISNV